MKERKHVLKWSVDSAGIAGRGIKGPLAATRRTYLKELHSENISLLITKDVWRKGKRK